MREYVLKGKLLIAILNFKTLKCWTLLYANIHKNTIRHEPSYKQLEVKTNRTSLLCGNQTNHWYCRIKIKE